MQIMAYLNVNSRDLPYAFVTELIPVESLVCQCFQLQVVFPLCSPHRVVRILLMLCCRYNCVCACVFRATMDLYFVCFGLCRESAGIPGQSL